MKNEILDEVWHNRDKFARQHNYDIHSMVVELQKMERQSDAKIVDRRKQMPNKEIESTSNNHARF